MFAATHSLVAEGVTISPARLVAGMVIGLVGILIGKMLIVEREHASIAGLVKLDARKAMLFIGVMTAHSFAEGVGVGVSFRYFLQSAWYGLKGRHLKLGLEGIVSKKLDAS
jgi:zinc transporter, ZIP family